MNKTMQQRVAELSATLPPIKEIEQATYLTSDMIMEAEDSNSYNGSFYCDGWIKPIFEGDFKGVILQKVEEFQVLRMYYICTRLEGLAYDEIPEEWEEDNSPEMPEMEITDTIEYRQIWMSQSEYITLDLMDVENEYNNDAFVVCLLGLHDWIFEPRHRQYVIDSVNQHEDDTEIDIAYYLSPTNEMLQKYAPDFNALVIEYNMTKRALKFHHSLKIAVRHHYVLPNDINDVRMYFDYLDMLSLTDKQMSLTNPKYVCPKNIREVHDKIMAKRSKILAEAEKRKIKALEESFAKEHSYLFGIEFDTEHFHFSSLDSVEAYHTEGEIMHHCIYRAMYYNRHDVLSMHITDHEGNRVATCSVNVATQKIEELQTMCNDGAWRLSEEYKEIYNILCARMHTFPRRKKNDNKQVKVA